MLRFVLGAGCGGLLSVGYDNDDDNENNSK